MHICWLNQIFWNDNWILVVEMWNQKNVTLWNYDEEVWNKITENYIII